jgi:hypothetical protein
MKAIGAVILCLASAMGSSAYFPVDIENHARWVVLGRVDGFRGVESWLDSQAV